MSRAPSAPDAVDVAIGGRIRARRLAIGAGQDALARRLGVSPQQIHKYEQAQNRVTGARLLLIAEALGVTVGWLVGEENEGPAEGALLTSSAGDTLEMSKVFASIERPEIRAALLALARDLAREANWWTDRLGGPPA